MRYKPLGKFSFDSQHVGRLVDVFFATDIAADSERSMNSRARGDRVGLGKRNLMSVDEVTWNVVDVVLAIHNPAVGNIFPHGVLP